MSEPTPEMREIAEKIAEGWYGSPIHIHVRERLVNPIAQAIADAVEREREQVAQWHDAQAREAEMAKARAVDGIDDQSADIYLGQATAYRRSAAAIRARRTAA